MEEHWLPFLASSLNTQLTYELNCYSYPDLTTTVSRELYKIALILDSDIGHRISSLYFRPFDQKISMEYGVKQWDRSSNLVTLTKLTTKLNHFTVSNSRYPSYWTTRVMGAKGQEVGVNVTDLWLCCGDIAQNISTTELMAHIWVTFLYNFTTPAIISLVDRLESEATLEGLL